VSKRLVPMTEFKQCRQCGALFEKGHGQNYCKIGCANRHRVAQYTGILKTCPACAASFRAGSRRQQYCSKKCYHENKSGSRLLFWKGDALISNCKYCGKEYRKNEKQNGKRVRRICGCCSIECSAAARGVTYDEEKRRENKRQGHLRWLQLNGDSVRKYGKAGKRRRLARRLWRDYGITLQNYEALLAAQNNVCAVCYKKETARSKSCRLSVDHDHTTGLVRGLLCGRCNTALGMTSDSIDIILRLVDYLHRNHMPDAFGDGHGI